MEETFTYYCQNRLTSITLKRPSGQSDNLGSWVTITDANGIAEQQMSFDAWGNRRDPQTWANYTNNDAFEEPMFDRGFTGHEHLYSFGLVNMNGRMYDPAMSSFLSPDRYVQNPWSAQGFNRYAYCMYNPLRLTDPTGWLAGGGGGGQLPTVTIGGTTHYVLPEVVVIDDNHSLSNPPPLEEVWYTPNMNGGGAGPQWSNVYNGQSIGPSGSGGGSHGGTSVHKTTWARPSIEVCNRQNWLRQLSEFWQKENPSLYWDSNGDGKLQYKEADNWWLNAKGEDIYVDNSKIDWSGCGYQKE